MGHVETIGQQAQAVTALPRRLPGLVRPFAGLLAGTRIATPRGPVRAEALMAGDTVITRDRGAQPLRWVGQMPLSPRTLATAPEGWPVRLSTPAAPGANLLHMGPAQRTLVISDTAEAVCGSREALVTAGDLVAAGAPAEAVFPGAADLVTLLLDAHDLVLAEGIWVDSLCADDAGIAALPEGLRRQLLNDVERLAYAGARGAYHPARPLLTAEEAALLLA